MKWAHTVVASAAVLSVLCIDEFAAAQPENSPSPAQPQDAQSAAGDKGGTSEASPQDRALAEALFQDGRKLGSQGKIAEACQKFKASQELDPQVGTLLHLAACYQQAGKNASAWAAFSGAADLADREHQTDRAALARQRAAALEGQLAKVTIVVANPPTGMVVQLDGRELSEGSFTTPLPVDSGSHVLKVTAPGKKEFTREFTVNDGASEQSLEVPALEDSSTKPVAEAKPAPAAPREVTPPSGKSAQRPFGFAVIGVGVLGVGVGSYFGLHAASQAKDADKHCQGSICTQQGLDGHASAQDSAMISDVAFGAGLMAIAVGTYFVLTSHSNSSRGSEAALELRVGVGQASVGGSF